MTLRGDAGDYAAEVSSDVGSVRRAMKVPRRVQKALRLTKKERHVKIRSTHVLVDHASDFLETMDAAAGADGIVHEEVFEVGELRPPHRNSKPHTQLVVLVSFGRLTTSALHLDKFRKQHHLRRTGQRVVAQLVAQKRHELRVALGEKSWIFSTSPLPYEMKDVLLGCCFTSKGVVEVVTRPTGYAFHRTWFAFTLRS